MKVKIHTKSAPGLGCDAVDLGDFDLPTVPRVGEYVVPFDGWCAFEVLSVDHFIYEGAVWVEISPDTTGEVAEEVARRKGDA